MYLLKVLFIQMLTFLAGGCIGFMSGDLTTLVGKNNIKYYDRYQDLLDNY